MKHLDDLLSVIDAAIAESSVNLHGLKWCGLSQADLAERMGVSVSTGQRALRDAEKAKQVDSITHQIDGERVRFLRRHDGKSTASFRLVVDQRIMAAEYLKVRDAKGKKKIKRVAPKAYGRLKEICLTWPEKERIKIFQHFMVRKNWRCFMSTYTLCALAHPEEFPHFQKRHYQHPNIFALADGAKVAEELYFDYQEYQTKQALFLASG